MHMHFSIVLALAVLATAQLPASRCSTGQITIPGVGTINVTLGQPFMVTINGTQYTFTWDDGDVTQAERKP